MKIRKIDDLPEDSIILKNFDGDFHYRESYSVETVLDEDVTVDNVTRAFFSYTPFFINYLSKLRDLIVMPFGLRTGSESLPEISFEKDIQFKTGEKAVFFNIINRNENEIVMGEDDKHLYFRTSVLIEKDAKKISRVYSNTVVHFHNFFGRVYFFPVKPLHKLMIRAILKNFIKITASQNL